MSVEISNVLFMWSGNIYCRRNHLLCVLYFYIMLCGTQCCPSEPRCPNITVALLIERSAILDFPFQINRSIGVVQFGMNKSREILKDSANLNFIIRYADVPTCTALEWGALAAEVYHNNEMHAIIGPGCTPSVETVSRMAVKWNLPHITYVGTAESLGNKEEFRMLSRLSFTMNVFAKFYMEVFKAFKWANIANIYSTEYLPNLVGTSLQRSFEEAGVLSRALPFSIRTPDLGAELLRVLNKARGLSRVFLVSCYGDIFRKMVLLCQDVGMAPGEYVFIFFFQLVGDPAVGAYTWERGDELDMEAKKAFESVMVIRPRRPTTEEFFDFEKEAMRLSFTMYNYSWPLNSELSIYNIGHYDSFILYALALNDTLANGDDPRDGLGVVKRMWNRTFPGIGGMVYVNEHGDRDTDFTLLDMEPVTGNWRVVAQYLGYTHMFELLADTPIHWPDNRGPPLNRPPCGYDGELCRSFTLPIYASVAIALSGVILVVLAVGGYCYRRVKLEAAIYSDWWRIKWEDVTLQTKSSFFSSCSRLGDDDSRSDITHATNVFQTIGIYKGMQVYIQKQKIKSLPVDRKLLMELKQMRDITCPNLTRLIGLCPDNKNVCIITEYCSRGSLQDILHNESIQLDWDFRISLINDIVQGLYYLHTSPIQVHGRLTSSRCVIDSRFVLKITGFGLPSINGCKAISSNSKQTNPYAIVPDLLWMAPEHLRVYPQRVSTQQGDIYSFAIIVYEMCTRNEPYVTEAWYKSVEDTVSEIKKGGLNPRRPCLAGQEIFPELITLIEDCWVESPQTRPSIGLVRKTCFAIRRGNIHGKNVLDALLHRMEQYANNLEGLVEERTNAFLEEKKKSEELLYQVLPKSVADQLRDGRSVIPETYESVTVFFSDIVGFTNISAKSTPFEVVDFLNDVYICFDKIIDNFNVYKVETIGDSYMVVSGLPVRNHYEHVREIALMSLSILDHVAQFIIRHQPATPLQARIGIHTGPVCAGVVGMKMPRYCLFGDTVNVASRMESTGEASKIQISDSTKRLLELFGSFGTEKRGTIHVKVTRTTMKAWISSNFDQIGFLTAELAAHERLEK